jgi:predicted glutamine amidotransferase
MCRFFALRAASPLPLEGPMVAGSHALRAQASGDHRGETHPHGWGLGYYAASDGPPIVRKSPRDAAHDDDYVDAARTTAALAMAHVRQASVGDLGDSNSHPFLAGCWLFAHNGTVTNFELVQERLLAETAADLRVLRQGATDSELMFLWLLSRLRDVGIALDSPAAPARCDAVIARSVQQLADWSAATQPAEPTRLNLFLTDGSTLWAVRWGHSLHLLDSRGDHQAARGLGVVADEPGTEFVCLASEPLAEGPWSVVEDRTMLKVCADLTIIQQPLISLDEGFGAEPRGG